MGVVPFSLGCDVRVSGSSRTPDHSLCLLYLPDCGTESHPPRDTFKWHLCGSKRTIRGAEDDIWFACEMGW